MPRDRAGGCLIEYHLATCPANLDLQINAGDENDSVRIRNLSFEGPGISRVYGGPGKDRLRGPNGDKAPYRGLLRFDGGAANNVGEVEATDGEDTFSGAGTVDYSTATGPVTVTASRRRDDGTPGERDLVNMDSAIGSPAGDLLVGSSRSDALWGGGGNDSLEGYFGDDFLDGGSGPDTFAAGLDHDTLAARDDTADALIDCGYGSDSVTADAIDPVSAGPEPGCELVDVFGPISPLEP